MTTLLEDQWISLLSGGQFNYNKPEESDVTIEDISTALSNICRFSGHLPRYYSVAQHLVNTSYIVEPQYAFTALMHDTTEAFTNDLPTPLKWALPIFKELEIKIESAMADKFGFAYPYPAAVKEADSQMLMLEKTYVKNDRSVWPAYEHVQFDCLTANPNIDLQSWRPSIARNKFMARYRELRSEEERQQSLCAA